MEDQIVSAIQIAWDPASDQTLKRQAFDYVNQLRREPAAWQPCLTIFTQIPPQPEVIRVFSLEIVNNAVQAGIVDSDGLRLVKEQLMTYLEKAYGGANPTLSLDSPSIENKIAQTITFLFSAFYGNGWETCFDDLLRLTGTQPGLRDNLKGTAFYLRVLNSVHDEIGDQLLSRSRPEHEKANNLKDLVRQRDVQKIALSWQEILGQWRMTNDTIAELCLKAVGKWVSWVDISFVVNQPMLELLFEQLQRAQRVNMPETGSKARDAAIDVFTETVGKKMAPSDKIDMLAFLNLESVVSQLTTCPPLADQQSSVYDVDLAETVAKLVNITVTDIIKVLESENSNSETWQSAERTLGAFLPHLLRFFSDDYDEVCSTVINAMSDVLTFLRRTSQGQPSSPQRTVMLLPILKSIFTKMRYDETASWGDEDDRTDEAEFQDLRKRLSNLQQMIAGADEQLYTDAVSSLVQDLFSKLQTQASQVDWRDLDLALYQIYLMGDLAVRGGGLYAKNRPNSPAAEKLIQMMQQMVQSSTGSFNHPAIQLQYMEICCRYTSFFEKNPEHIQGVLKNFLRCAHHPSVKVTSRAWYLVLRFVRALRATVGNVAEIVVSNLQDLLVISAELPSEQDEDEMSSDVEGGEPRFNNQLFLFEAIGCICGALSVPHDKQVQLLQVVMQPLFSDVERCLESAKTGNELAVLQIHHDIMALGVIARGYSDCIAGNVSSTAASNASSIAKPSHHQTPEQVRTAFIRVSEATLVALASLKSSVQIRTAARSAFSRLIGIVGSNIMSQLPQWVDGLLTESSSRDEMALFLRLVDQVIYGFKNEIFDFLDQLFSVLLQRVFAGISTNVSGTDDEIELNELKREYLNFLLVVLSNDLGGVLVSQTNQPIFETVMGTIEHFARDAEDCPTAKMAFQVLARMCIVWGGPDAPGTTTSKSDQKSSSSGTANTNGNAIQSSSNAMPGFDKFMITRFSPLCWSLPSNPNFNSKDAQARQVLTEAAGLQKTIYMKTGGDYLTWLRDSELRGMGMDEGMTNEYLNKLARLDMKSFKTFFAKWVSSGGRI